MSYILVARNNANFNADWQKKIFYLGKKLNNFSCVKYFATIFFLSSLVLFTPTISIAQDKEKWDAHLQWMLNQQLVCNKAIDDRSPCNYFIGKALEKIWGYSDFKTNGGYLSANSIVDLLLISKEKWIEIGRGNNQDALKVAAEKATAGFPVVATRPDSPNGHIALILPGPLSFSNSWGLNVPNSASFFYNKPLNSYVGRPLSLAFSQNKAGDVKIYYRIAK